MFFLKQNFMQNFQLFFPKYFIFLIQIIFEWQILWNKKIVFRKYFFYEKNTNVFYKRH